MDEKDYAEFPSIEDEIEALGLWSDFQSFLKENPECTAEDFWEEIEYSFDCEKSKSIALRQ